MAWRAASPSVVDFHTGRKRAVAPTAAGLMVGRGALINPWLFDDIRNEKSWLPTAEERLEVYYSLVAGYRDTFGAVHKSNCCGASATAES